MQETKDWSREPYKFEKTKDVIVCMQDPKQLNFNKPDIFDQPALNKLQLNSNKINCVTHSVSLKYLRHLNCIGTPRQPTCFLFVCRAMGFEQNVGVSDCWRKSTALQCVTG